jgi:hypothetical protein
VASSVPHPSSLCYTRNLLAFMRLCACVDKRVRIDPDHQVATATGRPCGHRGAAYASLLSRAKSSRVAKMAKMIRRAVDPRCTRAVDAPLPNAQAQNRSADIIQAKEYPQRVRLAELHLDVQPAWSRPRAAPTTTRRATIAPTTAPPPPPQRSPRSPRCRLPRRRLPARCAGGGQNPGRDQCLAEHVRKQARRCLAEHVRKQARRCLAELVHHRKAWGDDCGGGGGAGVVCWPGGGWWRWRW